MVEQAWSVVEEELSRAADEGRTVRVWLRDDDAVAVTPALERLHMVCAAATMPVLLAVIPAHAEPDLGPWIEGHPGFTPCQHGYAHTNHAVAGARACELGGSRPLSDIKAELREGRARLRTLFGARLSDCLVPPWNRIDPGLIPCLPALGFDRLSTFGPTLADEGGVKRLNADLDIVDWRHGRVGREVGDVARRLAALIAQARQDGRPIGLLTHHLVHDDTAWAVIETMLMRLKDHPAVAFPATSALA